MEEVTADVVETAKELDLEVEPEDGTEGEELLPTDELNKWFLWMKSTPVKLL